MSPFVPSPCFVPPHVLEELARRGGGDAILDHAMDGLTAAAAGRRARIAFRNMPGMAAIPSPDGSKRRLLYDMETRNAPLPGTLRRSEGEGASGDEAVDEAFDGSGQTYDFYLDVFGRNSLDDQGMTLKSSVHYGQDVPNAFWDGEQMLYGDGDGTIFDRFTRSIEVIGHELTHGVVQYTANLVYADEPGALNESFSDVASVQIEQWVRGQTVDQADWWIGGEILLPQVGAKGIRTFTADKAFENNAYLGTDPQPKHMRDKYTGPRDYGGVHINSGIPNHAFYLVATGLGGKSWERAGQIWYRALLRLSEKSSFQDAADATLAVAAELYGDDGDEHKAVVSAWEQVGITAGTGTRSA